MSICNNGKFFGKIIESRKSSPIELGLEWTVNIDNGNEFIGKNILRR